MDTSTLLALGVPALVAAVAWAVRGQVAEVPRARDAVDIARSERADGEAPIEKTP